MKSYTQLVAAAKRSLLAVISLFITALAMAQDKVDIDINAKESAWYASPWVWVVGAAVFILLLVALTRGRGSRSDA
jgi:cytochrome bd-type quinol oxidase subunit 2